MQKIKFTYNEPRIGDMEIEGSDKLTFDEILKHIEQTYPEAIDIEILEVEDYED